MKFDFVKEGAPRESEKNEVPFLAYRYKREAHFVYCF